MSDQEFILIKNIFMECFNDSLIFKRPDTDGNFFEIGDLRKDQKLWLVLGAGLNESDAQDLFRGHPKKTQNASYPIRFDPDGKISLLFVVRPLEQIPNEDTSLKLIVPFAFNKGIPYLEMRQAHIRVRDLPENSHNLRNLRWEWDIQSSVNQPWERWLRSWQEDIGFNPAHPPSHLHLNTEPPIPDDRPTDSRSDLRLAIGKPNPLALIFSIAVWLRAIVSS